MAKTPDVQLEIAIAVRLDLAPADLSAIFEHIARKGLPRTPLAQKNQLWTNDAQGSSLSSAEFTTPAGLAFLKPSGKSGLCKNPEQVRKLLEELTFIPSIYGYEIKTITYGQGGVDSHLWLRPDVLRDTPAKTPLPLLPMPAERSTRLSPTY